MLFFSSKKQGISFVSLSQHAKQEFNGLVPTKRRLEFAIISYGNNNGSK